MLKRHNDGTFSRDRTARILSSVPLPPNVMSGPHSARPCPNHYLKREFGTKGVGNNYLIGIILVEKLYNTHITNKVNNTSDYVGTALILPLV
jgi:hypothetical protein